jgi:glycine hydroxymethyltransferase
MNYLFELTKLEQERQKNTLNLIASENYPSPKVLEFLGTVWNNKYGEGYPGKRYYAGNQYTDDLETFAQKKALEVFDQTGEYGVNVQVLSGTPANSMVFLSVLNFGDTILSLAIDNGGHISHLHETSRWLKFFKLVNYDLKAKPNSDNLDYELDLENFTAQIQTHKPKLVIIGFSAYTKKYEFTQMCQIAHANGCLVLADIAHINGLVATGLHDSPFKKGVDGADFVSMTTHKTFRGPRGALLFAKNYLPDYANLTDLEKKITSKKEVSSLIELVDKTVFPGASGGPHFNQIAAVAQACIEILGEDNYPDNISFLDYSKSVIRNTKALETGLKNSGLEIICPTQNHLCLVKLPDELDSLEVQRKLETLGIILNRNKIPFDQKSPWKPSGLRLGLPALTSRGITEQTSLELGELIGQIVLNKIEDSAAQKQVAKILETLNWWY